MRILVVTGGRDYPHSRRVDELLRRLNPEMVYVGDCKTGVDHFVLEWCLANHVRHRVFDARWTELGLAAGPVRNKEMVIAAHKQAAVLLAFPGNRGTANCVSHAKKYKVPVLKFEEA
jgi:hypothetical protein